MFNVIRKTITICDFTACEKIPFFHLVFGNTAFSLCYEHFEEFKNLILSAELPQRFDKMWRYNNGNLSICPISYHTEVFRCEYPLCDNTPVFAINYTNGVRFLLCKKHFVELQNYLKELDF